MKKKALITGVNGQDGSYLAELLLQKGYDVYGMVRRASTNNLKRINHILDKVILLYGDLTNYGSIYSVVNKVKPDECYHLGAQSFVTSSFNDEFTTYNINILGTSYVLSAIKNIVPDCRVYFAGSSEMFGQVKETPQNENTPFNPRSPYGISKVAGFNIAKNYREAYNMFVCSGILFNHESPRRGSEFVTKKIVEAVVNIKIGNQKRLSLGNLDAKRDWGYAREYVEAMWAMLQQPLPDDYVISTGETHSIQEFVEGCFAYVGIFNWEDYVDINTELIRPAEVVLLCGDSTKARDILGWTPKVKFEQLVEIMMDEELYRSW